MCPIRCFFFFNDTATTEIYTLSLHDALPIWLAMGGVFLGQQIAGHPPGGALWANAWTALLAWVPIFIFAPISVWLLRSEEHTSELQSQSNLVCRLLLEKKQATTSSEIQGAVS